MSIIDSVIEANDERKKEMATRILAILNHHQIQNPKLAILGVTFKPNTDDLREAPSLTIISHLLKEGVHLNVYDPLYYEGSERVVDFPFPVHWKPDSYAAMEKVDGVVILTEWNEFRALDLDRIRQIIKTPILIDLRNIYKPNEVQDFHYYSIGR